MTDLAALKAENQKMIQAQTAIAGEANRTNLALTYAQASMDAGKRLKS